MKNILSCVLALFILLCSGCSNDSDKKSKLFCDYLIYKTNVYKEKKNTTYIKKSLPEKYDLRDYGLVTPVKNQNPWNTCWGFSAIAASETSILNDLNATYDSTLLDLSELQLAWFANSHITNEDNAQFGEGTYLFGYDNPLDCGNLVYTATSVLSSGIGVVTEDTIPYQGKNKTIDNRYRYSKNDDWSVDDNYQFLQGFELIESNMLPNPVIKNDDGKYCEYNEYGTQCIKEELLAGRAVSICFHADEYTPNSSSIPQYINTKDNKWTHYTYDDAKHNHSVTIIGWDDTIKKEDFINHSNENTDNNPYYPEGDGAWIVKNSWGAETEDFPNYGVWGIRNENGLSTGYFYLSYYDHSLFEPESFRFSTRYDSNKYIIEQHDYLQSDAIECWCSQNVMKMANIFNASIAKEIRAVSCETIKEDTNVNIQIYKLNPDFINPCDGSLAYETNVNYKYAGYHRYELGDYINIDSNNYYSIVITEKFHDDDKDYYGIFVDKQVSELGAISNSTNNKYTYSKGVINEYESYIYIEDLNEWCDWSKVVNNIYNINGFDKLTFDNFSIKSYSNYLFH